MSVNLEYLKVFYYVAKTGSVTEAAKLLSISQPAASQSIKQLEAGIGVPLFYRVSRGVRTTREGELLFSYVEKGYEQMELGLEKIRQMQDMDAGEIRIGASDMTLQYFLLPYLERFHEQYPNIKVVVTNAPTPETLDCLRAGKIDFGVVSGPFEEGKGLGVIPVREIEDIFVAGRRFIAYKNRTLDLQELERLPLIVLEKNTSSRSFMDGYLSGNGVNILPEFELATSDMIVQFALRSLGVGCVVRDFAEDYLESGKLFALRFNKIIPKRRFCLVRADRVPLSAAAAKLWDDVMQSKMNV